ncbi:MAG TPA: SEC-C metal-binding domain-containing protein [Kofleriaceae bacterium]|jgi:hypothetical protein
MGDRGPRIASISRADVRAVTAWADTDVRAALAACDGERAATILFARAAAGETVAAPIVAEVLPLVRDVEVAMALLAIAGDGAEWIRLLRARRIPERPAAFAIETATLYAAWRAGADRRDVLREARRLSRYALGFPGYSWLAALVRGLDDADLHAATQHLGEAAEDDFAREEVAQLDRALGRSVADTIAALPAERAAAVAASGFTVRAAEKVGRNDPCPCGSGQKYKKCCADKPQTGGSPVAGLSWDEYVTGAADKMTHEDLDALPLRDLVRVPLDKLSLSGAVGAFRRFVRERLWTHAARSADELQRREDVELAAGRLMPGEVGAGWARGHREEIVMEAMHAGALDVARAELPMIAGGTLEHTHRAELELRESPPAPLVALEAMAMRSLVDEKVPDASEVAFVLMRSFPALGVLVARGSVAAPSNPADLDTLLDGIEEVRDLLLLTPADVALEIDAALNQADDEAAKREQKQKKLADDTAALRAALATAEARVKTLEKQAKPVVAPAPAPRVEVEPEKLRELRLRIEELEGIVREGVVERAELRKQLAAAPAAPAPTAPIPTVVADDDEGDELESREREPTVPQFSRRAIDALAEAPRAVAAEALRTIGALAAGDTFAWRRTKSARDMPRQVLMARVGIHHRLLFRTESGPFEVIDLVTRENLLTTLKRMRAARNQSP